LKIAVTAFSNIRPTPENSNVGIFAAGLFVTVTAAGAFMK
jgi:hypothetical protein